MKKALRLVSGTSLRIALGTGLASVLLCAGAAAQSSPAAPPPASVPAANPAGVVMQRNITLGLAKMIAEATLATCQAKGFHTSAAVVDRAGQILVILRDEQATAQQAELARRKAYTARMYRMTTLEFQKRTADPAYAPQREVADILALGGGVPIQVGGETIGGVASSGSNQDQDDACAKAGIAKVADLLK